MLSDGTPAERPHNDTTIELGGRTYPFRTPKIAPVISALFAMKGQSETEAVQTLAMAQAKWVKSGLGDDQWAAVEARLMDEDDRLDWPDIVDAFNLAVQGDAGRPTSSSSASSVNSQATTQAEAAPKPPASTFGL